MNQAPCNPYFLNLKPEGLLVVHSTFEEQPPTNRVVAIPFTRIARQKREQRAHGQNGSPGCVGYLSQIVSLKSLEAALLAKVPTKTAAMNLKAFKAGVKAARKIDLKALPRSVGFEGEEE